MKQFVLANCQDLLFSEMQNITEASTVTLNRAFAELGIRPINVGDYQRFIFVNHRMPFQDEQICDLTEKPPAIKQAQNDRLLRSIKFYEAPASLQRKNPPDLGKIEKPRENNINAEKLAEAARKIDMKKDASYHKHAQGDADKKMERPPAEYSNSSPNGIAQGYLLSNNDH